jgi:hypothetical protein
MRTAAPRDGGGHTNFHILLLLLLYAKIEFPVLKPVGKIRFTIHANLSFAFV